MSKLTNGYSFAYQLLGSLVWENKNNIDDDVINEYDQLLAELSHDKIFSELSPKDLYFLKEICLHGYTTTQQLIESLKVTSKEFSPYRDRLIKKGLLVSRKRGEFELALPRIETYIKTQIEIGSL